MPSIELQEKRRDRDRMKGAVVIEAQQQLEFVVVWLLPAARRSAAGFERPLPELFKGQAGGDCTAVAS